MNSNNEVKILIGSHGSGKSKWLYDTLIDKSRMENDKSKIDLTKRIYLVVPEQDTNDKQRILMKKIEEKGYKSGLFNIDVVSFDRLAYTVFERLKIETKKIIDDSGKAMILSIVISELKNKLKYYGKMVNRMGFAKKMVQAMSEFYAYDVIQLDENNKEGNKIQDAINNINDSLMKDKLYDLMQIYIEFVDKLKKYGYSIKEDKYDLLYKSLPKLKDDETFKDAIFAFEGFTGFTPIQLNIFGELVKMSSETYVVIDYRGKENIEKSLNNIYSNLKKTDVFFLSKKFLYDIDKKLGEMDTSIEMKGVNYNKENKIYKYEKHDDEEEKVDLKRIEECLYNYDENIEPLDIELKNVELYETKSAEDEIINIAHVIKNEIKNQEGLRYSDIKIVVPNVEDYSKKISNIFKKYDIPVYVDNSKSILNSPYIETIRAALDVITYNFSYDSIMRYINAGIFYKDSAIFELDNFIREYGIRGYNRYKNGFEIIFKNQLDFLEKQINDAKNNQKETENLINRKNSYIDKKERIISKKNELFNPLVNLYEKIQNKEFKKNILSFKSAIEDFIAEIDLDSKFNSLLFALDREITEEEFFKDDKKTKEYSKDLIKKFKRKNYSLQYGKNFQLNVLNKSVEVKNKVFDIINNIFVDSKNEISILDFKNLLDVGFTDVEIKTLPQSVDQVIVGDLMRSRFDNPKIQICMGFNQSKVPTENNDNTIIDDRMRKVLEEEKIYLSQNTFETALNQRMYLYLTLTNPTNKLILSYPKLNINKSSDEKSTVIIAIERLFGKYIVNKDNESVYETNLKPKKYNKYTLGFYSYDDLYDYVAENMQSLRSEYDLGEKKFYNIPVKKAIKYLSSKEKDEFKEKFNNSFNRISRKDDESLDKDLAKDIFSVVRGGTTASVSYIESYNRCPYKHFLENTIKLRERKRFDISATDLGTYIHKILELIFSKTKSIDDVSDKIIEDCIKSADAENIKFQNLNTKEEVFYGSNKINAVKSLCKKILNATIDFIKYAKNDCDFNNSSQEEEFSIKIDDITFVGKVDKIEFNEDNDTTFVNVIDYKSGKNKKTLSKEELEKGVSIQLLLYLSYCTNERNEGKSKKIIPCGAFYLWVDDPIKQIKSFSETNKVNINRLNLLSYDGLVNDNLDYAKKIKNTLEEDTKSKIYIYKETGDTGFVISGVKFNTDDENLNDNLDNLINNTKKIITDSIGKIKGGEIEAKPYKEDNCKYCNYIDICRRERFFMDEDSREQQTEI